MPPFPFLFPIRDAFFPVPPFPLIVLKARRKTPLLISFLLPSGKRSNLGIYFLYLPYVSVSSPPGFLAFQRTSEPSASVPLASQVPSNCYGCLLSTKGVPFAFFFPLRDLAQGKHLPPEMVYTFLSPLHDSDVLL